MADASANKKPANPPPAPVLAAPGGSRIEWRTVWPLPAAGLAAALLLGGIVVGVLRAPKADPAAALPTARALVEEGKFEPALEVLNSKLLPVAQAGLLSAEQLGEFHLLRARTVVGEQSARGLDALENHRQILEDYARAIELKAALNPADLSARVEAHLAAGEAQQAIDLVKSLPEAEAARRAILVRKVIESNLAAKDPKYDLTAVLLSELVEAPGATLEDRAWAVARQTELRLSMGFNDEAVTKLLRTLPRLEGLAGRPRGELLYMLGLAYFRVDQLAEAARQLDAAQRELGDFDELRADVLLLRARIMQAGGGESEAEAGGGRVEEARDRFAKIVADFEGARAVMPALLGLAETTGAMGEDEGAIGHYTRLLEMLEKGKQHREVDGRAVAASLMERHTDRFQRGQPQMALRYAELAQRGLRAGDGASAAPAAPDGGHGAHGAGAGAPAKGAAAAGHGEHAAGEAEGPAGASEDATGRVGRVEVLRALAESHRRIAADLAAGAGEGQDAAVGMSPVTASAVKRHLIEAGTYFRELARAAAGQDAAYSRALWEAAESFDEAGDREASQEAFQAYVDGASERDARRVEARFRLARLFEAQRQFGAAAALYEDVVAQGRAEAADSGGGGGPWGDRAVVPLARCLLQDGDAGNDERGERLLAEVLAGTRGEPESSDYRDALIELGEHAYSKGLHPEAIERLEEAAKRYPDAPQRLAVLYKLADAHRRSAGEIAEELREPMPETSRQERQTARAERLRRASALFQDVIDGVTAKDARIVSDLDRVYRRNAALYLGDTAFELGDMQAAVRHYEAAAQAYADDPASLMAMTQIVAAYAGQGRWAEAAAANERARRHLAALPEQAFDSPDVPMQRRHWEAWLRAIEAMDRRKAEATAQADEPR